MKKLLVIFLSICISLTTLIGSTGYASDGKEQKINQIITNPKLLDGNKRLENLTRLTEYDIQDIKRYSNVTVKKINEKKVEYTIINNIPERTIILSNGAIIKEYSASIIVANYGENYQTLDVEIYARMQYSQYERSGFNYCKLNYGYGKLVNCWENGYRNLKIENGVYGGWEDPDGTSGYTSNYLKNSTTISAPSIGTLYSKSSPSSHYYAVDSSNGTIGVKVSIEWRHGTKWYTTSHSISKGDINIF